MNIGLIQTRGIGDIVIAAPIAQYFIAQGHEVYWPVDRRFHAFVQIAFPTIHFLPVDHRVTGEATLDYFYLQPLEQLRQVGCGLIHCLYSYLSGQDVVNAKLAQSLKFDEYKYAVTSVPFSQKWNLKLNRDLDGEQALFQKLSIKRNYVVVHEEGSNYRLSVELPQDVVERYQIIRISALSENPFDWVGVIERASMLVCVDSCFANLAEQLDLCTQKFLFLRSDIRSTPVFKNNWQFK